MTITGDECIFWAVNVVTVIIVWYAVFDKREYLYKNDEKDKNE